MFHLSVRWMMGWERCVISKPKEVSSFEMCSSTSGHDTTMASSYGKTISISTIIIIILPSLSFTSNKTFPLGSHTKSVCVCVFVLSQNFPLLLRNGHTSKMLLSFHSPFFILFHYLYQQQKRAESSNKKK